jgi:hypothetical protein
MNTPGAKSAEVTMDGSTFDDRRVFACKKTDLSDAVSYN